MVGTTGVQRNIKKGKDWWIEEKADSIYQSLNVSHVNHRCHWVRVSTGGSAHLECEVNIHSKSVRLIVKEYNEGPKVSKKEAWITLSAESAVFIDFLRRSTK